MSATVLAMSTDLPAQLMTQNRALAELLRHADPAAPVPTCPEWTLRRLGTHVGRGDRWAAMIVRERSTTARDPRDAPDGKPPADPQEMAAWLAGGVQVLVDAVAEAGADTSVWTFIGPRPAPWWLRRRLHETVVHRADAALAVGALFELVPEIAADGVSEWLELLAARRGGDEPVLVDGATMHLHATDDGLGAAGEWLLRPNANAVTWEPGHAKATVAVRGPAVDLLLVLTRRLQADRVEVLGDTTVLDTWLARTSF